MENDSEKEKERKKGKTPHLDLKELCKVWGVAEAEVVKSFLESNGILCVFRGKVAQSIHPFTADGLGEIKIFVCEEDFEVATRLLEEKPQE